MTIEDAKERAATGEPIEYRSLNDGWLPVESIDLGEHAASIRIAGPVMRSFIINRRYGPVCEFRASWNEIAVEARAGYMRVEYSKDSRPLRVREFMPGDDENKANNL
jgi:hypothetical protein